MKPNRNAQVSQLSKHLAFLSTLIADGNPTTGFEIANEAIIGGLRALGHRVSVIGFQLPRQNDPTDPDTHVLAKMNVENAEAGRFKQLEWVARALLKGLPVSAAKLTAFSAGELDHLLQRVGPFDAHVLSSHQMPAAFPELLDKPSVYVSHNVEHVSAAENARNGNGALRRFLYRRETRILQALEQQLFNQVGYVWCLSEEDRAAHGLSASAASTLPLVTPGLLRKASTLPKAFDVGMIGTWTWQPNFVGLDWFLTRVVPLLPAELTIAIAGAVPAGMPRAPDNVSFLGRVNSAQDFLNSVRVVPLVSKGGTGVQLKTIEAFQSGLACVATAASLRGIDVVPSNCVRVDTAEECAKALVELVTRSGVGTLPRGDGTVFYEQQKKALLRALAKGIAALDNPVR